MTKTSLTTRKEQMSKSYQERTKGIEGGLNKIVAAGAVTERVQKEAHRSFLRGSPPFVQYFTSKRTME